MEFDLMLALGLVVTAGLVAMATLLIMAALSARGAPAPVSLFLGQTDRTVFLFDGDALLDATPAARSMIASDDLVAPFGRVVAKLEPMFPGLTRRIDGLMREGRFVLCSHEDLDPPLVLRAELVGGLTRLTVVEAEAEGSRREHDSAAEAALSAEVALLRQTLALAPLPVWRSDGEGRVVWANGQYLRLAAEGLDQGHDLAWPLPVLFPADGAGGNADGQPHRRVLRNGEDTRWFEVAEQDLGAERLHFALPAQKLVQAETNLRDFMQTLTKTFAQLPIGLAIFDRGRVLQLFNPALVDLTALPPEFLIARPTLPMLLDAMRERKSIPEPKDYRSWRRRIVDLEEAAASGLFEETWTLPSGQTLRVTGRPHPNGALAFLFEDISTEMMRTRRYRADVELGQAVIDAMADAVVVFAQDGAVILSNTAAERLWGENLASVSAMPTGPGPIALWRDRTAPTLMWNDLVDYIGAFGPRDPWEGEARLLDGRRLECRVSALPHGATLVSFRAGPAGAAGLAPTAADPAEGPDTSKAEVPLARIVTL